MLTYLIKGWKKHFIYVQCGCGKQSKVNYRLNHDIMASFPLDSHPELLKLTRPQQCNSVRVHSYAYIPHWKGLNTSFISIGDVRSNQRWSTHSTMMTSCYHIHPTVTQNCQNLTQLQLRSKSIRVHLYAYLLHGKVLNHFMYVQYGCREQPAMVYSLNHIIMASFPLDGNQELPKSDPALVV